MTMGMIEARIMMTLCGRPRGWKGLGREEGDDVASEEMVVVGREGEAGCGQAMF
jgi:hypothetical protein